MRVVSVAHLVHTLRAYAPVISIAMLSVAIGYVVVAILLYILSPAQRTTICSVNGDPFPALVNRCP
jgi:hypothetical protein